MTEMRGISMVYDFGLIGLVGLIKPKLKRGRASGVFV